MAQAPAAQRPVTPASQDAVLAGYAPPAGVYDEVATADGTRRPCWDALLTGFEKLGAAAVRRRWEQAQRLIHEHGVTYNVYGDDRGLDRPWRLDPLPMVVDAAEWRQLQRGLRQRAALLNQLLADLYGPQRLLHDGLLPPELVLAHPGFLRPCFGIRPPHAAFLVTYAADLARSPTGQWWVLSDRVQAPSGAGYALENRIVLSRSFPDVYRHCQVQRLATYFAQVRSSLQQLAPAGRHHPKIVLLTPGPFSETYFEHAYLARYLGYTLVEGSDLTVRDNRVYLKTLGGLVQVDVILRRLDEDYCDPLELRSDSTLGVAGLVQAAHAGNVTLANFLGSGAVESPALLAFLPSLCRALLGEELILPSVATWWCGQQRARDEVAGQLERLVVKPAFGSVRGDPVFGDQLTAAQRAELLARVDQRPFDFVGQERVQLSTAPVWHDGKVQPRHVTMRCFAFWARDGFAVMPGALTRTSSAEDSLVVTMQRGGGSKDTWVLADGPVSPFSLLESEGATVALVRRGAELPSRVADNLFWLGRYVERAEGAVRLLRAVLDRVSGEAAAQVPEMPRLLAVIDALGMGEPGVAMAACVLDPVELERKLQLILFDALRPTSLRATLDRAHNLASVVRDRISIDAWRIISQLHAEVAAARPEALTLPDASSLLTRQVITLAAFSGLGMESMTRGQGWRFLDMGRRIERGTHTLRLVAAALATTSEHEPPLLEAMLDVADSLMTYRSRYQTTLRVMPVLDLLLIDESNPRSLAFQVAALQSHTDALPVLDAAATPALQAGAAGVARTLEQQIVLGALTDLRVSDLRELARADEDGYRRGLSFLLGNLAARLPQLSDALTRSYLSHAASTRLESPA